MTLLHSWLLSCVVSGVVLVTIGGLCFAGLKAHAWWAERRAWKRIGMVMPRVVKRER
jgi:hypothetical protein